MSYRITGLEAQAFQHLFGLGEADLARHGAKRYVVDETPGFPDRIEMRDCAIGETVLLLNHTSQPADTPYHTRHAIFVREGASQVYDRADEIPKVMSQRLLSLRAFDENGMMLDADVAEGAKMEALIAQLFANPDVAYIHVHNAKRGCYSGRIDRN